MSVDDTNDTPLKVCTQCKESYPATPEYFWRHPFGKHGLYPKCKVCMREYTQRHKIKIGERSKQWRLDNPERYKAQNRLYYQENKERFRQQNKRRYYENREARLAAGKRWRLANRERRTAAENRRRARKFASGGSYTKEDVELIRKNQKGRCWWCSKKLKRGDTHLDHRIPLFRGGSNNPSNLVLTCAHCNLSKNDRLPHEWSDRLL